MSVFFHSSESDINVALGEYQEFPRPEPEDAAAERTPKPRVLNISLRLSLSEATDKGETEEESCPQDWLTFGSSCYYISWQGKSWDDSRQDCLQRHADLVIINSIQEQAFLTGFTEAAWVGMTDREKEGTWVWVDGTPVNKDELRWALGQPDGAYGGEDCSDIRTMINLIGLNEFNCSVRNHWICEKTVA